MFKRRILQELDQWADNRYRKPLILRGARQVGKTTVVNEFGKKFDNYLYVNLEKKNAKEIFERAYNTEELITILFLYCNKTNKKGRTLIFLDEIQNSSAAIAQLRYFYEDAPEIHVIAAGSLLESLLDVHISFPVGRVEYMALRPCSFFEFLEANGEKVAEGLPDNWSNAAILHETLSKQFTTYTLIGGMPEVVQRYVAEKDIVALSNVYDSLLQSYRDDAEKYATRRTQAEVIRYILSEGWGKAGQAITLGGFAGSAYKAKEMGEAFRTLEKAFILELVYPVTDTKLPTISNQRRSPKLIWLDTGLVNFASDIQREFFNSSDIIDIWKGAIAEQIVAQELLTLTTRVSQERNYWVRAKEGSNAEVDFIWIHRSKIIPIEVKSGSNAHLRSLHSFMDNSSQNIAVRIWKERFSINEVKTNQGKKFFLFNMPYYLIGALPTIMEEFECFCVLIQILEDYGYHERVDEDDKHKNTDRHPFIKRYFYSTRTGKNFGIKFDQGGVTLSIASTFYSIGYNSFDVNKLFPFLYFVAITGKQLQELKLVLEKTVGYDRYGYDTICKMDKLFTTDDIGEKLTGRAKDFYLRYKEDYLKAKRLFIEKYHL